MRRKIITRKITKEDEDEFDDTLLAQIDELLATANHEPPKPAKTKSPEDQYFDEIAEMLEQSDNEPPLPVVAEEDDDEFDPQDFFDQILKEIPKDQRPKVRFLSQEARDEMETIVEKLESDIKKSDAAMYAKNKRAAFVKKNPLEFVSHDYMNQCLSQRKGLDEQNESDQKRVLEHLASIETNVRRFSVWSPAKNQYMKILNNKNLSTYAKVQQLVQTANEYMNQQSRKKKGFLLERLTHHANSIHESIAKINLNDKAEDVHDHDKKSCC